MRRFCGLQGPGSAGLLLLAACGSVEVPHEHYYRLEAPRPEIAPAPLAAVLRVDRVQAAAHLLGDRLMVTEGPVSMRPYQLHRWAASVEHLVVDVLLTGLTRSQAFAQVKGPGDPGSESLVLAGRVLQLEHHVENGRSTARVTLDVQMTDTERGVVVFRAELARELPVARADPGEVVAALSAGLAAIVGDVIERSRVAAAVPGR